MRLALCALLCGAALQAGEVPARPPAGRPPLPGGLHPIPPDDPLALEAMRVAQRTFRPVLARVEAAWTQVVAGVNVRIVCRVRDEEGETRWAFTVWRRLDGTSRLQVAQRLEDDAGVDAAP